MKKLAFYLLLITSTSFGQDVFKVIENKDYVKFESLLKDGISTEQFNENGLTPLWLGVFKNDTTIVNLLFKHKADANLLSKNGMPPIIVGCISNSFECVQILIKNGADVNWKSSASRNQQPIRFASKGGSLNLVKLLLAHGADMESSPDDKATPLLAALHAKKFDIADFYFKNNANVGVVGRDGETVIHEAIKTGSIEMVRLAIKYKAPLDIKDENGKTTLELAKQSGNTEIKDLIKSALETK